MASSSSLPSDEQVKVEPTKPVNKMFAVTSLLTSDKRNQLSPSILDGRYHPLKRKDTPIPGRRRFSTFRDTTTLDESFLKDTRQHRLLHCSPNVSNYSSMSDQEIWTSEDPCSSAQADARLAAHQAMDTQVSRTAESQCDTGYSSQSPGATYFPLKPFQPAVENGEQKDGTSVKLQSAEPKQIELKKNEVKKDEHQKTEPKDDDYKKVETGKMPENVEMKEAETKKELKEVDLKKIEPTNDELKVVVAKKTVTISITVSDLEKKKSDAEKKDDTKEDAVPTNSVKPTKVKIIRKENEKVEPPNDFEGTLYGHRVERLASFETEYTLDNFNRNPNKFFRQFDSRPWYRKAMPLLFGKSHKSPADVVKTLREVLIILDKLPPPRIDKDGNLQTDKKYDKALDEVSKNVAMIKSFIYGNDATDPSGDHVVQVAQLAQEVYNANILPMLVKMLPKFEFECKKDVGQIFNNLLRRQIGTRSPTVEYLGARPEILIQLVQGYSVPDIALTCGLMLRESIRHDHLAKIILTSDVFYTFFLYVQSEVFDIASDAFSTFKELTTRHKAISAEFLDANYDTFFAQYQNLLNSKNYVTRRQSLKLLGELLLDRHNFNIMTKYISNPENLRLMMELLRDKSRNIQYEAFHVFKVFVANPNKPKPISDILMRNREKLVEFLGEFHNDRTDDEQFNDEKAYLIKQIQEMRSSPKEPKKQKPKEDEPEPQLQDQPEQQPQEPSNVSSVVLPPEGPSTSQQQ